MWYRFCVNSCIFMLIVFAIIKSSLQILASTGSNYVFEIQDYLDFENKIIRSPTKVLVQFHAPWCGPCKTLSPLLVEYANKNEGKLILARVDIAFEDLNQMAREYGIRQVPAIAVFKGGRIIDLLFGFDSEKITLKFLKKHAKDLS